MDDIVNILSSANFIFPEKIQTHKILISRCYMLQWCTDQKQIHNLVFFVAQKHVIAEQPDEQHADTHT